jgi:streptogramin lyase/mono/diheme cytochrome c family protein
MKRDLRLRPFSYFFLALISFGSALVPSISAAQNSSPERISSDGLQRSVRIDNYQEAAPSGAGRGETIYFYKCWVCHNKYTQNGGPHFADLFQRSTLLSGDAVNDETVTRKIKNGGPRMPSFRTTLSDADVSDLVGYIRSGKCCVEGDHPPANPWYVADKQRWPVQKTRSGGVWGIVRIASGQSPEGIGVQLVAPNGVRTTVYTNASGRYEFPSMQAGKYILRIPTPREFKPLRRDSVEISGSNKLDDIVLESLFSATDSLPPTREIESQLTSAELFWNLPGTGEEKDSFLRECTSCHTWQQILRNHYDERSWRLIVDRMANYALTALLRPKVKDAEGRATNGEVLTPEDFENVVKWLSKVRGPDSKDSALHVFNRPQGISTRVVITEYEIPREAMNLHDAWGDSHGNVWYTSHRTNYVGKLDPATGIVTEYQMPLVPNALPGTQAVRIGKNGVVLFSENWSRKLDRLDPETGKITQIDQPGFSNFGLDPEGFIWFTQNSTVMKMDAETGQILARYPHLQDKSSYDNLISNDGKFWAGGGLPSGNNVAEILNLKTGEFINGNTGAHMSTAKRGGFDPDGNAWFGGGDGALIEMNAKLGRIQEFWPPTPPSPYTYFYEAMPDKNGEVWAAVLYGREFVRFNPKTGRWIVYQMPEPYAFNRRTWIDNSTTPVTVWYADYNGFLARIQPLD